MSQTNIVPSITSPTPSSSVGPLELSTWMIGKAYLRDNYICYRCCASTKHVAKDCKLSVKCRECGSERHVSALHPGPAPWSSEETRSEPEQSEQQLDVTTKCTKICVTSPQPRSCSKICLVKVHPSKHREKAQHVYAVLDDQSNRSLAKTQFFDLFCIEGDPSPYTLRTCSGTVETAGRKASSQWSHSMGSPQ